MKHDFEVELDIDGLGTIVAYYNAPNGRYDLEIVNIKDSEERSILHDVNWFQLNDIENKVYEHYTDTVDDYCEYED